MWTEDNIKKLRLHALSVFGTEIPLSSDIEKTIIFLNQCKFGFKRRILKITKTVKYSFAWLPNGWTSIIDMDIPENLIDKYISCCKEYLNEQCDQLAKLSNFI